MNQLNRILLGVFGVQLLIGLWVCTRGGGPTLHRSSPLLDDVDAEEVSKVQIFGRKEGDKTDVEPDVVLTKEADGWVLSSHGDYPADAEAVKTLIGKLAAMKSRGAQTTSRSRHAQLEVADDGYQRKILVTTPRGERTVYLGSSPGFRQVAVRIDDSDQTHSVADITTSDADPQVSVWIDPAFVVVPVDNMQSVSIERPGGTLALERGAGGQWTVGGAPADQAKVTALLGKLASIDLVDIAGVAPQPGWGLDQPQARVTIAFGAAAPPPPEGVDTGDEPNADHETIVIEIGAEQEGKYYLRALHKKHIVRVARAGLEEVVTASAEKLGAGPPPAPDGEPPPAPRPPAPRPPAPKPPAP